MPTERFPPAALDALPQDILERITAVQEKSGFVPNVFLMLARRPEEFRAFFAAILRVRAADPLVADQVGVNHHKADITPRQRAMLDFALKVALESHRVDAHDYATLGSHGFSDEDAWDIGAIAAFFALSNRMANITGLRPNPEFYSLGRERRA